MDAIEVLDKHIYVPRHVWSIDDCGYIHIYEGF